MVDLNALLERRAIRRMPADPREAQALIEAARRHLKASRAILEIDRAGEYVLAYDAVRKAVTAHMAHRGYSVVAKAGAHAAVVEYASTLDEPSMEPFDRMRRNRNRSEYGTREFSESEVQTDTDKAELIVERIGELLDAAK